MSDFRSLEDKIRRITARPRGPIVESVVETEASKPADTNRKKIAAINRPDTTEDDKKKSHFNRTTSNQQKKIDEKAEVVEEEIPHMSLKSFKPKSMPKIKEITAPNNDKRTKGVPKLNKEEIEKKVKIIKKAKKEAKDKIEINPDLKIPDPDSAAL